MNDEKKLYFAGLQTNLSDVKFTKLDDPGKNVGNISVVTKDTYEIIDVKSDNFTLKCSRLIELNPKVIFSLNVSFDVTLLLDKKTVKDYENKIAELKKTIDAKIEKIIEISGVYSKISALISSITMQINGNPIISSPNYLK